MTGAHHTVFLGMAAGVGKTYRMLQEGQRDAEAGRDVAIGYLEAHGRRETLAQAAGLEVIPRRQVTYRDAVLEEMSLPNVLRRAPELCLVDELAHTNAPGLEHRKRYEDIDDLLAAGIDVLSTVNVQHLESLNDQIAELTDVRVRETIPDAVLGRANEIVIVDITPEGLLERLRGGKVYPPDRIESALNGFFRIENLAALREVALRQVAEEIGQARKATVGSVPGRGGELAIEGRRAVGERLLALVEPEPAAQRIVRRAWRSAQRLGADLDLIWIRAPGRHPTHDEERSLGALRRLASMLGSQLLVEESDDVAAAVVAAARRLGTTYILMGPSRPGRGLRRWRTPLAQRLVTLLPGIDVRIVADRSRRNGTERRRERGERW